MDSFYGIMIPCRWSSRPAEAAGRPACHLAARHRPAPHRPAFAWPPPIRLRQLGRGCLPLAAGQSMPLSHQATYTALATAKGLVAEVSRLPHHHLGAAEKEPHQRDLAQGFGAVSLWPAPPRIMARFSIGCCGSGATECPRATYQSAAANHSAAWRHATRSTRYAT
jgi:hypothetical protein